MCVCVCVCVRTCVRACVRDLQREAEVARRQGIKEVRRIKSEERLEKAKEQGREPAEEEEEQEEEDEEDLPPFFMPEPPSPLHCGFLSEPGMFWLSMVRLPAAHGVAPQGSP